VTQVDLNGRHSGLATIEKILWNIEGSASSTSARRTSSTPHRRDIVAPTTTDVMSIDIYAADEQHDERIDSKPGSRSPTAR